MANPEHVEILMQGVEVWNKWREENPEVKPDLSTFRLNGAGGRAYSKLWDHNLICNSLRGINFAGANLRRIKINHFDLTRTNFSTADMAYADFSGSYLSFSNIKGSNLSFVNLESVDLASVVYNRATKCDGLRLGNNYGGTLFARFALDQIFVGEYRRKYPILYWLWFVFADCGRSFWPWALWSIAFAVLFAALYYGVLGPESFHINGDLPPTFMTMTYYSVVTFTTLGFGDLTPATTAAAVWVMIEVVLGYIMLGGLISILANKLARRA